MNWTLHMFAEVECWYAWGAALEIEWSSIFRGVYFKIANVGFHIGYWKGLTYLTYQNRRTLPLPHSVR